MTHHDKSGDERDQSVRQGFGDDGGTRIGRPDAPSPDDRSMARLADQQDSEGIEGSALGDQAAGARATHRADGSSMSEGQGSHDTKPRTNDHTQRAESGMGGEANRGVENAQRGASVPHGTDEESSGGGGSAHTGRPGSEPLTGREREHKPSYGGEGGSPRTSSDQRERH